MADLSKIIKAYDVRGLVGSQLNDDLARAVGVAFVKVTGADSIVIGKDMRPSSPALSKAFAEGAMSQGADVLDIGLASTDQLYFASGSLDRAGAMFTASHNPAAYNGIKLCRPGASPVGQDTGLREISDLASGYLDNGLPDAVATPGSFEERDLLPDYAAYMHKLVPLASARPLKVVVDAGNGMAGHTVPVVFADLPFEVVPMYFELDGNFPNHEANPLEPANVADLQKAVLEHKADIGLAFDGDADRCFVIDERGEIVSPSTITGLVAVRELKREPGATVIHNLITSRSVAEIITENGGTPYRSRVGHSFIKADMASTGAIFGGEHSGHFYFRDFWKADSGMLAALHTLAALSEAPEGTSLSSLLADYTRYAASGEINSEVADAAERTSAVEKEYSSREGVTTDRLDGLTVTHPDWVFNLRPSNTEPLLRLNVEAADVPAMEALRDEVLAIVRG